MYIYMCVCVCVCKAALWDREEYFKKGITNCQMKRYMRRKSMFLLPLKAAFSLFLIRWFVY